MGRKFVVQQYAVLVMIKNDQCRTELEYFDYFCIPKRLQNEFLFYLMHAINISDNPIQTHEQLTPNCHLRFGIGPRKR